MLVFVKKKKKKRIMKNVPLQFYFLNHFLQAVLKRKDRINF